MATDDGLKDYICEAIVTSKMTVTVRAANRAAAREAFSAGDWESMDEDGGETIEVRCILPTVKLDPLA
jgi:hypothetical protein